MNILVTGGAGFIGSHVCKELAMHGHRVVVFDNLSTGHLKFVKWGPLFHGDLLDTEALRRCFSACDFDGVIHCAAKAYVGESMENPGMYFRNNVTGTLSLLEAMRSRGVANIVVSSSCAVYGQPETGIITEDHPTVPVSPYGESKLFMERIMEAYRTANFLNWVSLRYFNAAGADPDRELWEEHTPETHLIPRAIMAALGEGPEISIFGGDYDTPDGTCVRDYVHVSDLARAHVKALLYVVGGGLSCPMNLGTGVGTTVLEVLQNIYKLVGTNVPYGFVGRRPGDPAAAVASYERAQTILGWTPNRELSESIYQHALHSVRQVLQR